MQTFSPDPTINSGFYSASSSRFYDYTGGSISQPTYTFVQRMTNVDQLEIVPLIMDYSTPSAPTFTVGTEQDFTISSFNDTIGVMSINAWRYENLTYRQQLLFSFDYIDNAVTPIPERLIRVFDTY